jgi:hypothetical protein
MSWRLKQELHKLYSKEKSYSDLAKVAWLQNSFLKSHCNVILDTFRQPCKLTPQKRIHLKTIVCKQFRCYNYFFLLKNDKLYPWTNFSLQDEPWAKFSTLKVAAACILHLLSGVAIQPNLELKTRPKQLLGSLLLVIALPAISAVDANRHCHSLYYHCG